MNIISTGMKRRSRKASKTSETYYKKLIDLLLYVSKENWSGVLETETYSGRFAEVDVDQSGFYTEAVYMEELCYCIGTVSIHNDGLYAAHISPGQIGCTPEEQMETFQEGNKTYVIEGIMSGHYDCETLDTVLRNIEGEKDVFKASEFAVDTEGRLFSDVEERPRRSPLL